MALTATPPARRERRPIGTIQAAEEPLQQRLHCGYGPVLWCRGGRGRSTPVTTAHSGFAAAGPDFPTREHPIADRARSYTRVRDRHAGHPPRASFAARAADEQQLRDLSHDLGSPVRKLPPERHAEEYRP